MAFTRSAVRSRLAPPPAYAKASAGEAFARRVSAEALAKEDLPWVVFFHLNPAPPFAGDLNPCGVFLLFFIVILIFLVLVLVVVFVVFIIVIVFVVFILIIFAG